MIVKGPKKGEKGDLRECGNWRGISLSSIAIKLFCTVILNRLKPHLDLMPRDEQAGFRKGRSCAATYFADEC